MAMKIGSHIVENPIKNDPINKKDTTDEVSIIKEDASKILTLRVSGNGMIIKDNGRIDDSVINENTNKQREGVTIDLYNYISKVNSSETLFSEVPIKDKAVLENSIIKNDEYKIDNGSKKSDEPAVFVAKSIVPENSISKKPISCGSIDETLIKNLANFSDSNTNKIGTKDLLESTSTTYAVLKNPNFGNTVNQTDNDPSIYIKDNKCKIDPSVIENVKTDILKPYLEFGPKCEPFSKGQARICLVTFAGNPIKCVLKCSEFKASNERFINNLRREYYICRTFGNMCENVVKVIDIKEIYTEQGLKKNIEMLFEYGGKDLQNILPSLDLKERIKITYHLACTLEVMERAGLAHLDIKLPNIVRDEKTSVLKLIDFGSAISFYRKPEKVAEFLGEQSSKFHEFTITYSPPEVIQLCKTNFKNLKNREDIIIPQKIDAFSAGIVFAELLLKTTNIGLKRRLDIA